jgi:hypothetical protein
MLDTNCFFFARVYFCNVLCYEHVLYLFDMISKRVMHLALLLLTLLPW